jgi:hypothetical protein
MLGLGFAWLWGQVPRAIYAENFKFDYLIRLFVASFLLTATVLAKRLWKYSDYTTQGPGTALRFVLLTTWGGLIVALAGIIDLAIRGRR